MNHMNDMNNMNGKSSKNNFFSGYSGQGSIFVFLFSLLFLYLVLTKTLFAPGPEESGWLDRVNRFLGAKQSGEFLAKDKQGNFVTLEWEKAIPKQQSYFDAIKKVSDLYCLSRIDVQLDFWRRHPEKCPESLKAFIKEDMKNIDLNLVKEKACALGKLVFSSDDFSDTDDLVFFVNLRDKKTNEMLGSVIFGIGGEYEYGDIFIRDIVSKPEARDRGLGKLMASSIFKILPELARVRVYVLDTNKNAMMVYSSWDFHKEVVDPKTCKEARVLMGYDIEKSRLLQQVAANLKLVR